MAKIVIFGKGTMAEMAHFYFTHDTPNKIVAFCLDDEYITQEHYLGLPMVPFSQVQDIYPPDDFMMYVALGYKKMNKIREQKYFEAKAKGYKLASYVSSRASNYGVEVGDNTFILDNNVIMPLCKIGNNITVWLNNILAHHTEIGDHTTITSHVALGSSIKVESHCFFGLNSTLIEGLTIAQGSLIAAGSLVTKSTESFGVYMGSPAKKAAKNSYEIDFQ